MLPAVVPPEELRLRLANQIRRLVWARRTTLGQLAKDAEVSRATVQALVAGRKSPTLDTVAKLAMALHVDPIELLRGPPRSKADKPPKATKASKATDG